MEKVVKMDRDMTKVRAESMQNLVSRSVPFSESQEIKSTSPWL